MQPEIFTVPLCQLASGDRLQLQVYRFVGAATGTSALSTPRKKAYLQANLHGAEVSGNVVLQQLIHLLQEQPDTALQGEIWLLPMCNPLSANQRSHFFASGRYNPYDGQDWNRIFWDYEQDCSNFSAVLAEFVSQHLNDDVAAIQAAFRQQIRDRLEQAHAPKPSASPIAHRYRYCLQSLALDADYVLDLHSSSNQAIDYLYCCRGREASAPYFGLDFGIVFDQYDGNAFDEAFLKPWLALEDQFAHQGRPLQFDLESWTLELGSGMTLNPRSIDRGLQGILRYLHYKGLLNVQTDMLTVPELPLVSKSQLKKYYAPNGGLIQDCSALGRVVQAGDRLYTLLSFNREGQVPQAQPVVAEAAGVVFDRAANASVNQGEYVVSVAEGLELNQSG